MRADDDGFGPMSRDQIETRRSIAIEADVGGLIRIVARHRTGMKEQDHMVFCGAIVDGPVGAVVVILLRRADLSQAAKSFLMKPINLFENIRSVELDVAESDKAMGMLADKRAGLGKGLWCDQEKTHAIHTVELGEKLVEHSGFAIEVLVNINELWSSLGKKAWRKCKE
jgi:hypothetical protein